MTEKLIVEPDPRRMIEGLRDTGYSFNTAIADLIDNSIAAEANNIRIWIDMDYGGEITMMIADDGAGMNRSSLINAMKYGSSARPNPRSLGKFGLGMKTASTAFCKSLSVVSRGTPNGKSIKATWDLDHVAKIAKWELLLKEPTKEDIARLDVVANGKTGTLLVWEKVDRLLKEYSDPKGKPARKALNDYADDLKEHIGMIYQRFLDSQDKREKQKTDIWVNNKKVEPWDPFCQKEGPPILKEKVPVATQDGKKKLGDFTVRAFVLPRKEEFSTPEAGILAKVSTDRQGFYIYRENRLIHYGDWMGMFIRDTHLSLLRVELSFDSDLDDAFQVDIKKSRIALNNALYKWISDEFLPPAKRAAEDRSRQGQKKNFSKQAIGAHDGSNRNIQDKEKEIQQAEIRIVDAKKGEVEVTNSEGTTHLRIAITPQPKKPGEVFIQPVDTIDDGLLWQPVLIQGHQGVQINKGHSYYHKVYLPNILEKDAPVGTVQGMDALLWALGIAELKTVNKSTKDLFSELRFVVSSILRKLVEELPEPPEKES